MTNKTSVKCVFENFNEIASPDYNPSKWIASKPFCLNGNRDTWLCLMYRPISSNPDYAGLYVEPLDLGPHAILRTDITLSVDSTLDCMPAKRKNIKWTFENKQLDGQGWPLYFRRDNLNEYIDKNCLTVHCEIEVLSTVPNVNANFDKFTFSDWTLYSIGSQLEKLQTDENYECRGPMFNLNGADNLQLQLLLKRSKDKTFCELHIVPAQLQEFSVNMTYLAWIEDQQSGVRMPTWIKNFTFNFNNPEGRHDSKFFAFDKLHPFIKRDTLQIHCQIYHTSDTIVDLMPKIAPEVIVLSDSEDDSVNTAIEDDSQSLTSKDYAKFVETCIVDDSQPGIEDDNQSLVNCIETKELPSSEETSKKAPRFSMQELADEIRKLDQRKKTENLINFEIWKGPEQDSQIWKNSADILPNMYAKICASLYVAMKNADMLKVPETSDGLFETPIQSSKPSFINFSPLQSSNPSCNFDVSPPNLMKPSFYGQISKPLTHQANKIYYPPQAANEFPTSTITTGQLQRATPYSSTNVPQKPVVQEPKPTVQKLKSEIQESEQFLAKIKADLQKKEEFDSVRKVKLERLNAIKKKIGMESKPYEVRVEEGKNHLCEIHCNGQVFTMKTVELSSKSEVFKHAILERMPTANQKVVFEINSRPPLIIMEFVDFLKQGIFGNSYFIACELALLAKEFEIPSLKRACAFKLINCLSVENVCHLLSFAFQNEMPELANKTIEFAAKNREVIEKTVEWAKLCEKDDQLSQEVRCTISKVYNMYTKY